MCFTLTIEIIIALLDTFDFCTILKYQSDCIHLIVRFSRFPVHIVESSLTMNALTNATYNAIM